MFLTLSLFLTFRTHNTRTRLGRPGAKERLGWCGARDDGSEHVGAKAGAEHVCAEHVGAELW